MVIETDRGGEVLRLSGRFDADGVRELRKAMQASRAERIAIDFSRVAAFDEKTLPFLTVSLVVARRKGRRVSVRGLGERHMAVLQHYGYEPN